MPYMLLVVEPPDQRQGRTEAQGKAAYDGMLRFGNDLRERGLLLATESLTAKATRVDVRQGQARFSDGPFAEAKELESLGHDLEAEEAHIVPDFVDALDDARTDVLGDDLLRLMFTACHPVLPEDARLALTLKLLGGLSTDEIARAFLVKEATIAQRIVRAKRTLASAGVAFELPHGEALARRLVSVLQVIYLIYNEGYTATSGDDWMRPALCMEALRLGRMLAELAPEDAEVHGLVALMEIQSSRAAARVDAAGRPVLLLEQDRGRWDRLLIRRGLAALARAEAVARAHQRSLGSFGLQGAIAACHARAATAGETDWHQIAGLYGELTHLSPSPVVELNRAVAVGMASGPQAGLDLVEALAANPSLQGYHWLPSVRGDLLARLGRVAEARQAFEQAAALARNGAERALLIERANTASPGASAIAGDGG